MKFCTSCGAQLEAETKFCPECGQHTEPAVVHVYGQPVSHTFSEPTVPEMEQGVVHTYGAPVNHSFTPPVQAESALSGTYGAPSAAPVVPEPVEAPATAYEPTPVPEQPAAEAGTYTAPVAVEEKKTKAPRQKKQKSGKKKSRLGLIIGIVVAVALLFTMFGGGDSDDPNLGLYNGVSCSYGGFEMSAEGEWIELKSGGKATLMLMGEDYSARWELSGTDLTVTQAGDSYYGTLENGILTLDFSDVIYTYIKEAGQEPAPETQATSPKPTENQTVETQIPETQPAEDISAETAAQPLADGLVINESTDYLAISGNMNGTDMNDSAIAQMGGMDITLNGDGTGTLYMFGQSEAITYDNDAIYRSGMPMAYTLDGDYLYLKMSDAIEFTMMVKIKALNRSKDALTPNDLKYWSGDYYGWWVIDNVLSGDAQVGAWWDACMTLDIFSNGSGFITIWDEDYGKDDPIAEVAVSVTVNAGVARIVSESGQFMGVDVNHADWLFYSDSTGYEDTLGVFANYEDGDLNVDYYFFLRQWGTIWDDVEEKDLPGYYESWYLPLIEDGEVIAPGTIG